MGKTLDIYIRVSQIAGREGESFQSPGDQERTTRRALEIRGYEVSEVNQLDLDASGGTIDRPGFQRVLQRIETGQVDGIAVIRADRFARSVVLGWEAVERIQQAGGVFFSASEEVDLLSPSGKQYFTFLLMQAQYVRDLAIENWQKAQRSAADRGIYIGRAPVGYTRARDMRGRPSGPLILDPDAAPHVAYVFRARAEGKTLTELAAYLTRHVPARRGDRWSTTSVRKILDNRAYRGELHYGNLFNPQSHEPIVTEAEFQAANATRGIRQVKTLDFLLTGYVRCAGCSYKLRPQASGGGRRYYRCGSQVSAGRCENRAAVSADALEAWVEFHALARHDVIVESLRSDVDVERTAAELHEATEAYKWAFRQARESKRPELLEDEVKAAERRMLEAEAEHARVQGLGQSGLPRLFPMRELWPDWTLEEQREAIETLLDFVAVRGSGRDPRPITQRAYIFWRGTGPEGLPVRGKFVKPRPIDWSEDVAGVPPLEDARDGRLKGTSLRTES